MSDASVTAISVIHVVKLIERVQSGDPEATRELAARAGDAIKEPNKRVGTVFRLKRRGGEPKDRVQRRAERDRVLRELTELQAGTTGQRIRAVRSKHARYAANGWPHERNKPDDTGNRERDLLRKVLRLGLSLPGERQYREILKSKT